jgi:hypothetical protein
MKLFFLLIAFAALPLTAIAADPFVWRQSGFDQFSQGRFGDAGANTYVTARGRIELINRWDLNHDGSIDLVFANTHPHAEKLDAAIYWGNGRDFSDIRSAPVPNAGAQRTIAADLDGDGKADAIVPSYNNGTWSKSPSAVYLTKAIDGAEKWDVPPFARKIELPTQAAQSAAVADFNRDGRPDIAFAQSAGFWEYRGSSTALQSPSRIYWGTASGFDAEKFTDIEAAGASDAEAADLNKDGWPDLVLANRERAGKFDIGSYIYWGGEKGFSADRRVELATNQANAVTSADVNGDGWLDVIFANGLGDASYVYISREGKFDAKDRISLPTSDARDVAAADVDGDNRVDLLFTNHQTADNPLTKSFLYLNGEGGLSTKRLQEFETCGAWGASIGDLNGDKKPEIVVSNYRDAAGFDTPSYIYWNSSRGFSDVLRTSLFTHGAIGNTIADFNGDGQPDVMFNNTVSRTRGGVGPLYVYWGNDAGEYSTKRRLELPSVEPYGWAAGDLNLDGRNDLLVANQAEIGRNVTENFIYWGGERGFSETRRSALLANAGKDIALADLDRDGHLDAIVVNSAKAPAIFIYWGSDDGFVTTQRSELPSSGSGAPTMGDLNGDGKLDLIVHGSADRPARVYFADGTRKWDPARGVDIPGSEAASNSEVADMNRDGHLDLLLIHRGTAKSYVYYGDGTGAFTIQRRQEFSPLECQGVTVADVNQDGWLDVVCPAYKTGGTRATLSRIYLGGKDGLSEQRIIELPTNGGTGSQVADYNRDGFNDVLLICHRSEGDADVAGAVSDHVTSSYLYWGSKDGFSADRKLLIPARGAHYDSGVDLGNIVDRGFGFDYISAPFEHGSREARRMHWIAETPFGSAVALQVRSAATRESLADAKWLGPVGADSFYTRSGDAIALPRDHRWCQYRAVLRMSVGAATPSLAEVSIDFDGSNDTIAQVRQDFAADPNWEGVNNRVEAENPPKITQDFGYRPTTHASDEPGEIGGVIWRSRTPAWYGKNVGPFSFDDALSASGTIAILPRLGGGAYFGFFNSARQEWRPWSSMATRVADYWDLPLNQPPITVPTVDYMSTTWKAGGYGTLARVAADGKPHAWSFTYDPDATVLHEWPHRKMAKWLGDKKVPEDVLFQIAQKDESKLTIEDLRKLLEEASYRGLIEFHTRRGVGWQRRPNPSEMKGSIVYRSDNGPRLTHFINRAIREEPLVLDRFGIFNFQLPGDPVELYLSNLEINGKRIDLSKDPGWEGHGNHAEFLERDFHARHNFGYAKTNHAGRAAGEIGGTFWRTEPIDPVHGYYADDVGKLTLNDPIRFSGSIAFTAGGTDAGMFFGYFNRKEKMTEMKETESGAPMPQSMGLVIDGPTRIGYYCSAQLSVTQPLTTNGAGPILVPDAKKRPFTFEYDPLAHEGVGRVTFTIDGQSFQMDLTKEQRAANCTFDRFGLMNTRRGGKYVEVYFDDMIYSSRSPATTRPTTRESKITRVAYPAGGRKY